MPYKNKYIIVPKTDGNLEGLLAKINSARGFAEKNQYKILRGHDCLQVVRDDDALYVFGHGNLGHGLGPSISPIPADELATMLIDTYGLEDVECTIKLLACNSGIAMPGFEEDYAIKFARALCGRKFKNPIIDGYVGFVMPTNAPKRSAIWIALEGEDESKNISILDDVLIKNKSTNEAMRVRYSIKNSQVVVIHAIKWRMTKVIDEGVTDYKLVPL